MSYINRLIDRITGKRADELEKKVDMMLDKTNYILEQYSSFYQPVRFEVFEDMPLNEWIELNETAKIMLLTRTEHEISFLAQFEKGNLNYHNHPNAVEFFLLLDGEGELIIKDRFGKEIIRKVEFCKGKYYTVDVGLHHKFVVTNTAITWGKLRRVEKNED